MRASACAVILVLPLIGLAQEADRGFEMPLTVSGGGFISARSESASLSATAGGRAMEHVQNSVETGATLRLV
jgi:hypothetical protein